MNRLLIITAVTMLALLTSATSMAQEWRTEQPSPIDRRYLDSQLNRIDDLARRHLGRQLQTAVDNDIAILQALLDQGRVSQDDTETLQAMGIVLGELLKSQHGLVWVIYEDKLGRSRALQIPGINEFIFPTTQISRRAEVGIDVDVNKVYRELEQAVTEIRNRPRGLL